MESSTQKRLFLLIFIRILDFFFCYTPTFHKIQKKSKKFIFDKPQNQRVTLRIQIALTGEQVQAKEAIVAPALAHLKVARELPDNALGEVLALLVEHLDAVLVLGGLGEAGAELEEDAQVVAAHHPVAVRVHLQAPAEAVDVEGGRVDGVGLALQLAERVDGECARVVLGHDLADEVVLARE